MNTIIGHLNVKSMRKKFVLVKDVIKSRDVFLVPKSKLDSTVLVSQDHMFQDLKNLGEIEID